LKAVLDASPIIAFLDEIHEFGLLLLVRSCGYELIVPFRVWEEVTLRPSSRAILARCLVEGSLTRWEAVDEAAIRTFEDDHPSLGPGESEALLVAFDLRKAGFDVVCILDEKPARHIAETMDLPVKGTLGLLKMLRERDLITLAREASCRIALRGSSFRADESLLR